MSDLKTLNDILSKISIRKIGFHLAVISNLFIKPVETWQKLITNRKSAYSFFLLFVIYYSVLIYFIIDNSKLVVPITLLELILTLIPFSILILPFYLFRNKWKQKLQTYALFRLLFVLKIQFSLVPLGIILLIKWTEMESLYLILENFICIIWIAFIIILPIISNIKVWQKTIWIFANYIFCLIFLILTFYIANRVSDSHLLLNKISINTPSSDYLDFQLKYNYTDQILDNEYMIVVINKDNNKFYLRNSQFTTSRQALEIMKTDQKNLKTKIKILNSLIKDKITNISDVDFKSKIISIDSMDSRKRFFDNNYYNDKKLIDSLLKFSKFKSNKKLYKLHNELFNFYDSLYSTKTVFKKVSNEKSIFTVKSDKGNYIILKQFDKKKNTFLKTKISELEKEFENREKKSMLLYSIFTFPIEWISQKIEI